MIVDGHVHVWPDKIAAAALSGASDDFERYGDGTVASAIETMDRSGVDRCISLGVAPAPERVPSADDFAGSLDPDRFIGFGSIHARLSPEKNIEGLRRNKLKGAKVHPLYQGYALDDEGLKETLDAMQGEFAVIVHVGEGDSPESNARCTPSMMVDLVREFPRLEIIACHFGGYRLLDEAEEKIVGLPVHVDTSWPPGLGEIDPARVKRIVERHGADRVVFASDWPMADPAREIETIRGLGLDDADTDAILGGNLVRLLSLEG
ncbi:MAG TPA: amidohydrolase family protein [Solirubrobacterales bacterium]|jgi:predicted TIM-barrel fold metal-dependent hydrolase